MDDEIKDDVMGDEEIDGKLPEDVEEDMSDEEVDAM